MLAVVQALHTRADKEWLAGRPDATGLVEAVAAELSFASEEAELQAIVRTRTTHR